ncbi:nose resistant to fluoxetine protein 6-like [Hyposmocoma kahamanoa]|uniref:nose resistant to fluoxetine protein 6-like n=1 Tax=Hyposmocoma kahamanoa TaxID=1477025 RepID=UPI000E6D6DA5|nr:nose resistant to fluoxetine protein 6-like [Hyposmocoma kahamanoa]
MIITEWEPKHPPFDPKLYEEALHPELCAKQTQYLTLNDTLLLMTFLESGPRIPRGILQGNFQDLGNYHQCLGINREIDDMVIDGKYCQLSVGLSDLGNFGNPTEYQNVINAVDTIKDEIHLYNRFQKNVEILGSIQSEKSLRTNEVDMGGLRFTVAICIPKPCSTRRALSNLIGTELINYREQMCRFRNDKPWSPGLYVAIVVFSLIGILAILSTSYDIWNTVIQKRDPKALNTICLSFSVYTNSRRLVTYKPVRGSLECVDGIRAITMSWIILGHTFTRLPPIMNLLEAFQIAMSFRSFWMTSADISVDTFFMLSGLLVVYTTVGKISSMKLLKNLHLFYLNRYLRMFPLLAITILLQTGVLHYIYDGAMWSFVASATAICRTNWWLTLLYVQNFFPPLCIGHTWYLAIDMQLHILSPLVLFWVLSGKQNRAWSALIAALLICLTATSLYNFLNNFAGSTVRPTLSLDEAERYGMYYYVNTLARSSPFFVGMCFGYLIHYWRDKNIRLSRISNFILWIVNLTAMWLAIYSTEPMKNIDYDNQIFDNFVNSYRRPVWACGLGWIILACAEGYGGPINWFLSLRFWKLLSRLSYAMYLLHVPIQFVIIGAATQHIYFSTLYIMYIFCGQYVIYFIFSFIFTILVDSPFSNIFKIVLGSGIKKSNPDPRGDEKTSENPLVARQQEKELTNEQNKNL